MTERAPSINIGRTLTPDGRGRITLFMTREALGVILRNGGFESEEDLTIGALRGLFMQFTTRKILETGEQRQTGTRVALGRDLEGRPVTFDPAEIGADILLRLMPPRPDTEDPDRFDPTKGFVDFELYLYSDPEIRDSLTAMHEGRDAGKLLLAVTFGPRNIEHAEPSIETGG